VKYFKKLLPSEPVGYYRDTHFPDLYPDSYELVEVVFKPFGAHNEFMDIHVILHNPKHPSYDSCVEASYFAQAYRKV
jgi:hypothetical protein